MKREKRIALYKKIWCKIRYWQSLKDVSDTELAAYLQVTERTLHEYDKNAKNITLEKVDSFLYANGMEFTDLMSMYKNSKKLWTKEAECDIINL